MGRQFSGQTRAPHVELATISSRGSVRSTCIMLGRAKNGEYLAYSAAHFTDDPQLNVKKQELYLNECSLRTTEEILLYG